MTTHPWRDIAHKSKDVIHNADASLAVTHIAGTVVTVEDRYLRQRCSWCGAILVDYDLTHLAYTSDTPVEQRHPATWPVGQLVTVDGGLSFVLDEGVGLPDWSCALLDPTATQ